MDLLDDYINSQAKRVGKAIGWLTRCHENGDLERNFLAFIEDRKTAKVWTGSDEDLWAKKPSVSALINELGRHFAYPGDRDEAIKREAEAMGIASDNAFMNPMVIKSAITTAHHNQGKAAS